MRRLMACPGIRHGCPLSDVCLEETAALPGCPIVWPSMPMCPCRLSPSLQAAMCPCRLSEMCLEETVAHCAAAMLTFIKAITEEVVATMQKDVTMLQAFFSKYLKQDKVGARGVWGVGAT